MRKQNSTSVGRKAKTGQFVKIKDGRSIYSPPSGGKLQKSVIRTAVRETIAERREKADAS